MYFTKKNLLNRHHAIGKSIYTRSGINCSCVTDTKHYIDSCKTKTRQLAPSSSRIDTTWPIRFFFLPSLRSGEVPEGIKHCLLVSYYRINKETSLVIHFRFKIILSTTFFCQTSQLQDRVLLSFTASGKFNKSSVYWFQLTAWRTS